MVWGTITCEEKDPPIQNLRDVNEKSENFEQCELSRHEFCRVLKVNNNAITSIEEIKDLRYLLELQASNNQITDMEVFADSTETLKYLQRADLSVNKITSVPMIKCDSLYQLKLDENEITKVDFFGHNTLKFLSLNKNKMTNC